MYKRQGGFCTNSDDMLDYTCACGVDELTGSATHTDKDCAVYEPCSGEPCLNGGVCSIAWNQFTSHVDFACTCPLDAVTGLPSYSAWVKLALMLRHFCLKRDTF